MMDVSRVMQGAAGRCRGNGGQEVTESCTERREQIFIYIAACPPTSRANCSSCASASSQDRLNFTLAKPIGSVMKLKAG